MPRGKRTSSIPLDQLKAKVIETQKKIAALDTEIAKSDAILKSFCDDVDKNGDVRRLL